MVAVGVAVGTVMVTVSLPIFQFSLGAGVGFAPVVGGPVAVG